MASDTTEDQAERGQGALRTFLIADLRGYTRFSDEQGDEAASQLARTFAAIVREAVPPQGGEVLELRGDEALCVFGSARAALWTAVDLQWRFRERVDGEPALPLGVGIGLDAGEAVPTEGGYRGRALNVASRLCSLARPGEILASETVTNLAGRQEKARYAPRRPTRVKGLEEPVRHVELVPEVELPPLPLPAPTRRAFRRRGALAVVGALGPSGRALGSGGGAAMASNADRDGIASLALENLAWSSLPRAAQRPCSTQKEAIGTLPDFAGSRRLTVSTRSCLPPLTMSPAWMNTCSAPVFSICSSLTRPVSITCTLPLASASCRVSGTGPPALAPRTK